MATSDTPYIIYRDKSYSLNKIGEEEFMSVPLDMDESEDEISVCVGSKEIDKCTIHWQVGATEEDLFDF